MVEELVEGGSYELKNVVTPLYFLFWAKIKLDTKTLVVRP